MLHNKLSISNILIILSLLATIAVSMNKNLYQFGMNSYFFDQGNYVIWFLQMFTSQLLHGEILHFFSNALFIGYFGNLLEGIIGRNKMFLFFIVNSIFIGIFLTLVGAGNTVGISGFALAILSYYTLYLWKRGNPEYTGGITAIVINIGIGFTPGISFWGHFAGMIFGALFYLLQKKK